MTAQLEVVRAGALTTSQDLGRPGFADMAVPRSGALDIPALRLANRLVGNPEDFAVLETTVDGVAFQLTDRRYVAVTGARAPVKIGNRPDDCGVPILVQPGEIVDIGPAYAGLRCQIAVSGGLAVAPVMGSRSTDLLSGLGPPVVATGAVLPLGDMIGGPAPVDFAPYPLPGGELDLDCYLGPREDWVTEQAVELLGSTRWTVTSHSNRIALRLEGPPLPRRVTAELPSEGVVHGAIQVPANGQPVLFLADHPVTGGYPVVAVVPPPDVWLCAQAVPGTTIRFRVRHVQLS